MESLCEDRDDFYVGAKLEVEIQQQAVPIASNEIEEKTDLMLVEGTAK